MTASRLPLKTEPFEDKRLFPFFDGLIPEGWLLEIAEKTWKIGEALKLTERQVANCLRRFEKGLEAAIALIGAGFCSEDMKRRFQALVERRWWRLQ